jgi:NAD-dependent DNA ligase
VNLEKIDCSDLYHSAEEKLKRLDNDIDKTIQDLAKDVEARGIPKNKVAREIVRELTARKVLRPSRIYEGLGIEYKRKYKKKVTEETFPRVENSSKEESSINQYATQVAATGAGQSETLKDMNGGPGIKSVFEEQKQTGALRQENPKENERLKEKEESEPIKENARLKSKNDDH